jgi:hypothetical protein
MSLSQRLPSRALTWSEYRQIATADGVKMAEPVDTGADRLGITGVSLQIGDAIVTLAYRSGADGWRVVDRVEL